MSSPLKPIETPQLKRFLRGCELACERPGILVATGGPGIGKTYMAEHRCRQGGLPIPPSQLLRNLDPNRPFTLDRIKAAFASAGALDQDMESKIARRFYNLDVARWEAGSRLTHEYPHYSLARHVRASREDIEPWVTEWLREKNVRAWEERLIQWELGIVKGPLPWHPVYTRTHVLTTPHVILADLSRELVAIRTPRALADRLFLLYDALRRLRVLIIVDEAERLTLPCCEFLRDLHDDCATPLVLLGTGALAERLRHSPALRPLATRVSLTLELHPPTLKDVEGALPHLERQVLVRAWARAGGNLRLLAFIVAELERATGGESRRRPTPSLVDDIADLLPCSRPGQAGDLDELEEEARQDRRARLPVRAARARVEARAKLRA